MCSPATCQTCGKTTWRGCGLHIEEALAGVPAAELCTCLQPQPAPTTAPYVPTTSGSEG